MEGADGAKGCEQRFLMFLALLGCCDSCSGVDSCLCKALVWSDVEEDSVLCCIPAT